MKYLIIMAIGFIYGNISAQVTLTVDSTNLTSEKAPIFINKKMIIYQNTPAYIVNPYQMDYLFSLHRFIQDSIPDMDFVAEAYTWLLNEKDKDYKALLENNIARDKITLKNLSELNNMGFRIQNTLKASEMRINAALDKTLELQKSYRRQEQKLKIKRIFNRIGIFTTGAFVGFLATKL